mmetsp:Transcript_5183/g.18518  ORF Transcript_5183/g.18518 Transcript_5183/m.18518 type:complete len:210 (+) Transcript_5183:883-1512(+)
MIPHRDSAMIPTMKVWERSGIRVARRTSSAISQTCQTAISCCRYTSQTLMARSMHMKSGESRWTRAMCIRVKDHRVTPRRVLCGKAGRRGAGTKVKAMGSALATGHVSCSEEITTVGEASTASALPRTLESFVNMTSTRHLSTCLHLTPRLTNRLAPKQRCCSISRKSSGMRLLRTRSQVGRPTSSSRMTTRALLLSRLALSSLPSLHR